MPGNSIAQIVSGTNCISTNCTYLTQIDSGTDGIGTNCIRDNLSIFTPIQLLYRVYGDTSCSMAIHYTSCSNAVYADTYCADTVYAHRNSADTDFAYTSCIVHGPKVDCKY
jgi:hypothetical protein